MYNKFIMDVLIYTAIFILCVLFYIAYSSYTLQFLYKRRKLDKKILNDFLKNVKGDFNSKGYFAPSHKFIRVQEYKSYSKRHQMPFSLCYNVVTFRTPDANFEFFFHMVKESGRFSEVMNLRVFPKHNRIKSEGNVDKNYSRLNIYSNNRYLTAILESSDIQTHLKELLRSDGDIMVICENNMHYKIFVDSKSLSVQRIMDMIKSINYVKNKIYKDNVLEY